MKLLLIMFLISFSVSCGNSSDKNVKTVPVLPKEDPVIPGVPPTKVKGVFKGESNCKSCPPIQVILTIKDSSFNEITNHKNAKDKKHSMEAALGRCVQDNGVIKLYNKLKVIETYKIISQDSILLIDSAKNSSAKTTREVYLIRNKAF